VLARVAINVKNPVRAIVGRVYQDFVDHGVRNECAVSGCQRIGNSGKGRIEVGMRHAAAFARTAIVARAAAVQRPRKIRDASGRNGAAKFLPHALAEERFLASQRNRRLKKAVWKMFEGFFAAADADVSLDEVIIWLDVLVTERPAFVVTIMGGGFEIPIAVAQAHAAPNVGPSPGHAQAAHPEERLVGRSRVWFLEIVDEPVRVVFAAGKPGLDRPCLAQNFRSPVAVLQFESGLVSGKLFVGLRFAGFEKRDLQSRFRQAFARPSPGGPGTHNDDVVKVVLSLGHVVSVKNGC